MQDRGFANHLVVHGGTAGGILQQYGGILVFSIYKLNNEKNQKKKPSQHI